jgi:hypothetical protein
MISFFKKLLKKIAEHKQKKVLQKKYKERLEELKKRDPFIYNH